MISQTHLDPGEAWWLVIVTQAKLASRNDLWRLEDTKCCDKVSIPKLPQSSLWRLMDVLPAHLLYQKAFQSWLSFRNHRVLHPVSTLRRPARAGERWLRFYTHKYISRSLAQKWTFFPIIKGHNNFYLLPLGSHERCDLTLVNFSLV